MDERECLNCGETKASIKRQGITLCAEHQPAWPTAEERESTVSITNPLDMDPLAAVIDAEIPNEVTVWRFSFSQTIAATVRQRIAEEIEAERLDTGDGICFDAYINGLRRAEKIAREGR